MIRKYEEDITNPLLNYLSNKKNIKLIGKNKIINKNRAPTISFTVNNKTSSEISDFLIANKIATRNDNFYAWRCLEALGIDHQDGVVRTSMVHYNTEEDVNKLINVFKKIQS